MKYQIYLNKETTEIVNYLANKNDMKPSTFIKLMVEGGIKASYNFAKAKMEGEHTNEPKK